jgi:hypothetical protein
MPQYRVIIPTDSKPAPAPYEIAAAKRLAEYFMSDVEFIPRSNNKTPDFLINAIAWELKSPQGSGRNNIQRQLQYASRQSKNIVISASRSKLHINKIKGELSIQFQKTPNIQRLLLIDKMGNVIEISR